MMGRPHNNNDNNTRIIIIIIILQYATGEGPPRPQPEDGSGRVSPTRNQFVRYCLSSNPPHFHYYHYRYYYFFSLSGLEYIGGYYYYYIILFFLFYFFSGQIRRIVGSHYNTMMHDICVRKISYYVDERCHPEFFVIPNYIGTVPSINYTLFTPPNSVLRYKINRFSLSRTYQ